MSYQSGAHAIRRQGNSQTRALAGYLDGLNFQITPLEDEIRSTLHPSQMADLSGGGRNFSGGRNPNVGFTLYTPGQAIENEKALDRDMDALDTDFKKHPTIPSELFTAWTALYQDWRAYFKKHGTTLSVLLATPGGVWRQTETYRKRLNAMMDKFNASQGATLKPSIPNGPNEKSAGDTPWWQPSTKTTIYLTLLGTALTLGGGYWAYRKYGRHHVARLTGAVHHYRASGK